MEKKRADEEKAMSGSDGLNPSFTMDPPLIESIIDNMQDGVVLADENRKVIIHNNRFAEIAGISVSEQIKGKRIGEVLDCVNAFQPPVVCGTHEACALCGFTAAIINIDIKEKLNEASIVRREQKDLIEVRVSSSTFMLGAKKYILLILTDITHEKRRRALEKMFFHDVMNKALGLNGLCELLKGSGSDAETTRLINLLSQVSAELTDELQSQKIMTSAENDEISVKPEEISLKALLQEKVEFYSTFKIARDKKILLQTDNADASVNSDIHILRRIMGNMIKNALEEVKPGETVTVGYNFPETGKIEIWVHNPGYMERDVQLQIFHRSFSTKGKERGLGTYSMKMLAERYLNGEISFISDIESGTKFSLFLNPGSAF
jgi:signal transduction histidine kinase